MVGVWTMGFEPLVWFCRPVQYGIWERETHSAFGSYTPCAIESVVGNVSLLLILGLCLCRIWLIKISPKVRRFCLRTNRYNYILALLASYCAAEPLFKFIMGISIFNIDAETGLAPFEVCYLIFWWLMHSDSLCITIYALVKYAIFIWYLCFVFSCVLARLECLILESSCNSLHSLSFLSIKE